MDISQYNPSPGFIDALRALNIFVGFTACIVLLALLAKDHWREWGPQIKLGWMALVMLCAAGTYGSFEIRYLDTYFRVPMVTLAMIWAIVAACWPHDKTSGSGKK